MFKSLYLFFKKSFTTKSQLILENVFLHKQLEIYQRNDPKLKISGTDRMFFSFMKGILSNWKERLFIVKPNTLIKWHRLGFVISGNRRAEQKEEDLQ
jgi:putative transposase